MTGEVELVCSPQTSHCTIKRTFNRPFYLICSLEANLPIPIDLTCEIAGCAASPYIPPHQDFNKLDIVTTVLAGELSTEIIKHSHSCSGRIRTPGSHLCCCMFHHQKKVRSNDDQSVTPLRQQRMYALFDKKDLYATLSWQSISCIVGNRKVLNDISGIARPGQITAILGPSGQQ